jgi:hypothetical protein
VLSRSSEFHGRHQTLHILLVQVPATRRSVPESCFSMKNFCQTPCCGWPQSDWRSSNPDAGPCKTSHEAMRGFPSISAWECSPHSCLAVDMVSSCASVERVTHGFKAIGQFIRLTPVGRSRIHDLRSSNVSNLAVIPACPLTAAHRLAAALALVFSPLINVRGYDRRCQHARSLSVLSR